MKKIIAILLALTLIFVVAAACNGDDPVVEPPADDPAPPVADDPAPPPADDPAPPANDGEEIVIGVSLPTLGNAFFVGMNMGFEEGAELYGVRLEVRNADGDVALQMSQIEDLITLGVDAVIITPIDSDAIVSAQELLIAAGIPIVYCDRGASAPGYDSFVATDNVAMGALGGELIRDFLIERYGEPRGRVVEIQGLIGTSAARDRGDGFNAFMENYPDIEIVARQPGDFRQDIAFNVMQDILLANPDIDAVFGHNDDNTLGALGAIEGAGLLREPGDDDYIFIVGIDGIADAIYAIREGGKAVTISQDPIGMGVNAVRLALSVLRGESVPTQVDQAHYVIDFSNAGEDWHWGIAAS